MVYGLGKVMQFQWGQSRKYFWFIDAWVMKEFRAEKRLCPKLFTIEAIGKS